MESLVKGARLNDLYITAGDRLYAIGSQDGDFPALGGHIPGEMGGLWVHPQKVMDGFWLGIAWGEEETVVAQATSFRVAPSHTEHIYESSSDWKMTRKQWIPDGMPVLVVDISLRNRQKLPKSAVLTLWFRSNLRPGWLAEEERGRDRVTFEDSGSGLLFYNQNHPWQVLVAATEADAKWAVDGNEPRPRRGDGAWAIGSIEVSRIIQPDQAMRFTFWIAASTQDWTLAEIQERMSAYRDELLTAKEKRLAQIQRLSTLNVPDADIQHAFQWAKCQLDWLVREVPGLGRGLGAGVPEYPWWFGCDSGYALRGALDTGRFDIAKETVRLLAHASDRTNGNGRIIHEMSTTGKIYNPGNTQESAQFCQLIWEIFRWSGDVAFVREMMPYAQKALDWVLQQAPDGDDLAYGYGIIEVEDLNLKLIDTAVYTWTALGSLAELSRVLKMEDAAEEYEQRAIRLRETIDQRFWMAEEQTFGDIIGSPDAMAERLARWAEKAREAGRSDLVEVFAGMAAGNTEERAYALRNWVINTPMEAGLAGAVLANAALARMREPDFRGPYGLYLSGRWKEQMMTISTGVQAVADARYGYADDALDWMRRMASTMDWRMPGSMSEMSPDGGCFVQAWTLYGLAVPVTEFFFGLDPRADQRRVNIRCRMPRAWPWAELTRVKMAENYLDFHFAREATENQLTIVTDESWTVIFDHAVGICESSEGVLFDGEATIFLPARGRVCVRWDMTEARHL